MDAYLLAALIIIIGFGVLYLGLRLRPALPHGRLIYIDSASLERTPGTLYDRKNDLAGRPDYIIRTQQGSIPVELKSSPAPLQPHAGHVLQLAAYCQLLEATAGRRPAYGIIRYRDRAFRIDNTTSLRQALYNTLQRMEALAQSIPARSHQQPGRCQACGYLSTCDQAL